jgi:hypothetical protein
MMVMKSLAHSNKKYLEQLIINFCLMTLLWSEWVGGWVGWLAAITQTSDDLSHTLKCRQKWCD